MSAPAWPDLVVPEQRAGQFARRRGTGHHHMRVYRQNVACWLWHCPCGGGVHSASQSFPTQHAALVSAMNHWTRAPGW